jgi:hypothetical protein
VTKMGTGLTILSHLLFGSTKLGKAAVTTMALIDTTLTTSWAVPHPETNRATCRSTSDL